MKIIIDILKIIYLYFLGIFGLITLPIASILNKLGYVKNVNNHSIDKDRVFKNYDEDINCNKCSELYSDNFDSQIDYENFQEKFVKTNFKHIGKFKGYSHTKYYFLGIGHSGESFLGSDLYKCKNCDEIWELSEPDNAWRGYFKPIEINNYKSEWLDIF